MGDAPVGGAWGWTPTKGGVSTANTGVDARAGVGTNWGALAGAGLMVGGGLLDYIGQRQGSRSMLDEAERQAAEQEALSRARHLELIAGLGRYDPNALGTQTGVQMNRATSATNPALAAGGAALGVSPGSVGRALLPAQRRAAQGAAHGVESGRQDDSRRTIMRGQQSIDDTADFARALYPMRSQVAGQKGSALRLGGSMMQGFGAPLMSYSMAQPAV